MLKNTKLTSVEIDKELYKQFKVMCIRYKFTLKELVQNSLFTYIHDEGFRKEIHKVILENETKNSK
jgi:hypothetical protein